MRRLSKYQKAVLRALKERGVLTIRDVHLIVLRERHRRGSLSEEESQVYLAVAQAIGKLRPIRAIKGFSGLYRMMKRLVKRGLVGIVLHT